MTVVKYTSGDLVIYRKTKHSNSPGPRAKEIHPAPRGDDYSYLVDKFWVVDEVRQDGRLVLRTRRGKTHVVDPQDPCLRAARWWEKLLHGNRFPAPRQPAGDQPAGAPQADALHENISQK
jgi:hypothetical protein